MTPKMTYQPFTLACAVLISAALLAGCNLPVSVPTAIPTQPVLPSPTPQPPQDTPTPEPPTPTFTPTVTATPTAIPIVFSTGATAGVATGTLQPGQVQAYSLGASQAQPIILILDSPHGDLYLGVTSPDGSLLLDPAKKWNRLQWLLPKTGTYIINVYGGAAAENYTLTAKVAQLVSFPSGSNNTTLAGNTVNGYVVSYAFYCTSGQTMSAALSVPSTTAYLDVFGIQYGVLLSSADKSNNWSHTLPATEDYIVEVIPVGGHVVGYSLTVSCH